MEANEILQVLNVAQFAMLSAIVAGVTELYGRAAARDFYVVGKILIAVITSVLIVMSFGVGFVPALAIGFAPSGGMAILGSIGKKSTAAPSTLTTKQ